MQAPCLQHSRKLSYNTQGSWKLDVKHMLSPQHSPINDRNAKQFKRGEYAPVSEEKQNSKNQIIWLEVKRILSQNLNKWFVKNNSIPRKSKSL